MGCSLREETISKMSTMDNSFGARVEPSLSCVYTSELRCLKTWKKVIERKEEIMRLDGEICKMMYGFFELVDFTM